MLQAKDANVLWRAIPFGELVPCKYCIYNDNLRSPLGNWTVISMPVLTISTAKYDPIGSEYLANMILTSS